VALLGGTTTWTDCLIALSHLLRLGRLVQGPAIAEFEQAFANRIGVRFAFSFSSGRVGFYGLLRTLEIGPGDEVLLSVPTHIVVANAVRYVGARPVYVDCRLDTYNMDLELAERAITPRTKLLVLQHTFGIPGDIDRALALARRHGLSVIEDCVHSLGATYNGRPVGSFGRAAFFSTEETKTISTTMGGMVVTDDPDVAAAIAAYQARCPWPSAHLAARHVLKLVLYHVLTQPRLHHFARPLYERAGRRNPLPGPTTPEEVRGGRPPNYERRLSNAQAAVGLRQLRRLDANLAHRRTRAEDYRERLSEHGFQLPHPPDEAEPAYVRYPVWVHDRAAAVRRCAPHAVLGTWFTSVLEEALSPEKGNYEMGSCPRAESVARHVVNLPTHPRVRSADVEATVRALLQPDR